VAITLDDDGVVFKDGNPIIFPRDGNYDPGSFLLGFDSSETIQFASFTSGGRLKVDSSVSIDSVDIGDVNVNLKVGGIDKYWDGTLNPDATTHAGYVQDQRMTFDTGSLNVKLTGGAGGLASDTDVDDGSIATGQTGIVSIGLTHGFNGSTWERLVSSSGNLRDDPIDRVAREAGRVLSSDVLFVSEAYATTDVSLNARPTNGDMVVRRYKTKALVISNTGSFAARVTISASVDNAATFDFFIVSNVLVTPGNTMEVTDSDAFTHIRILAKSNAAGNSTTITSKGYALGT
jgi:hypothetical protein